MNDILGEDYQSRIVIDNDKPLCVYGVSNTSLNGMHCIYFLGSKDFERSLTLQKQFLKVSRNIIGEWLQTREVLFNYIHKENYRTIRWLKSLGAVIHYDINDGDMVLFTLRKGDANV